MSFQSKIARRYELKVEAKTFEIFRGVKDVFPSQVDHRYNGDGVFGRGTYYALQEETAEKYASGAIGLEPYDRFAMIFGYSVAPQNPITITPKKAKGLTSYAKLIELDEDFAEEHGLHESFPRDQLGAQALGSEFDAVILLEGRGQGIDGEEQMLIPKGSRLQPKVKWMDVLFHEDDENLAEEIAKKLGGKVAYDSNDIKVVDIPLGKIKDLSKMLEKTSRFNERKDDDDD